MTKKQITNTGKKTRKQIEQNKIHGEYPAALDYFEVKDNLKLTLKKLRKCKK